MINIIPMAGLGSRFSDEGHLLPKPLIPVSGKPMIAQVIKGLPQADTWIFIVRTEHIKEYAIDKVIKAEIPDAIIIDIDKTTEGQASTCMLAFEHIAEDNEVFISACDNSFLFDREAFTKLRQRDDVDSVVWTFTKDPLLTDKPTAWGWLKVNEDGETIDDMSVKVPVSDDPFNDHAVVATFYFKRAGDFKAAYELMYQEDHRVNGEFYVDSIPVFMQKLGKKSVLFDVDLYVGWGKPSDLYLYQLHEHLYTIGKQKDDRWNKFFKTFFSNNF